MPLFDLSYQRYAGPRTGILSRILALALAETRLLVGQRRFLALLVVCWVPAILRGGQIYAVRQFPQMQEFVQVDAALWQQFLTQQAALLFLLVVGLYVGASAIAQDFQSGALTMYLAKPFSRRHYLVAKALPVLAALGFITLVPAMFLLALQLSFAGDIALLRDHPLLPLSVLGYASWLSAYFGMAVLAMSALSSSGRLAGAGVVILMLGSEFLQVALRALGLDSALLRVSMMGYARDAGHIFFGTVADGDHPGFSLFAMSVIIVGSVFVILRRLRQVEVSS